eukprot:Opistho-1_new@83377
MARREDDVLAEFLAVTGADEAMARSLLEATDWNLEQAASLYLEDALAQTRPPTARPMPQLPMEDDVRAPIPQTTGVLIDDDDYGDFSHTMERLGRRQSRSAVFEPLRDFRAENDAADSRGSSARSARPDASLGQLFAPPTDITFLGSLKQAMRHAASTRRWLLVNVQKTDVFACQVLNRDLWSDPDVREFIRDHLVLWQVYYDAPEGIEYQRLYPFDDYPHIALLHPTTGERIKWWSEPIDSNELLSSAVSILAQYSDDTRESPAPNTNSRKRRSMDDEEVELRAAIAASLADAEREEAARAVADVAAAAPRTPSRPTTANTRKAADAVPDEPPASAAPAEVTRVQVRMPDGKRIVRRFYKTDTLGGLFAFVRSADPSIGGKPFEIMAHRDKLGDKPREMSLAAAGVLDALLTVSLL